MVYLLGLYLFNTLLLMIVAIREVRRPANALNWLMICLLLPILGFGLYWATSNPIPFRRERLTSAHHESDALPGSFSRSAAVICYALRHLTVGGLRKARVQLLVNGNETYDRLIESIHNAQRTIDLEYYIYRDDRIGRRIMDLLIERAASGVRIRFLRDGWGSRKFPRTQIRRMMEAGIECRTLFPLRFPWILSTLNHRDHCKIVVIDRNEAFTGGINVGDEYTGRKPHVGFWRDTHVRIVGEAAKDLLAVLDAHWSLASPEPVRRRHRRYAEAEADLRVSRKRAPISRNTDPYGETGLSGVPAEWGAELGTMISSRVDPVTCMNALHRAYIQTFEGNPGIPTQVIRQTFFICLTQAARTIDITTPYFIPDADIIMAIKTAVARGVRVRLLVPRRSDQLLVGLASRTYYGELLEAGVHIYLYEKGVLHSKVMIIDEETAEVGAANYDMRSFRLNYEVCEVIYSAEVARQLTIQFERDLADSVALRLEDLLQRSLAQRIIEQGARLFSPMM